MIQISFIGNLTKDAEFKSINEKGFNAFSVAVNNGKNEDGSDKVMFIDVMSRVYNESKNLVLQYLKKGSKVYIQGVPSLNMWTAKDGTNMCSLRCMADKVELCGQQSQQQSSPKSNYDDGGVVSDPTADESGLPF